MNIQGDKMNPFPGLRPFHEDEDYLFFGREEQTMELLQRLGSNRFVAVVGTSGSGKSSLVRCGLLSELLGGKMLQAGAAWEIAVTHPGGNPLAILTEALLEADLYDREEEHARENLLATLSRSHFGLVEAVKQAGLGEGTNFLLVVDQFEEIFRFNEAGQVQREVANEFISILLEAAAQSEVPIYVVLTMRSDFIGECGQFEGLAEMVNRGEFLIPRLSREQYKRVIEGPIKVAGGQIAPRLLQRLLNDLGQQADQLPCLQHALMRTWSIWSESEDTDSLDLDDYQQVGKMTQALSLHADEIFESLETDRQRELCRGIFQALTVQESDQRGIRRPQRLGKLSSILEVSTDEILPIIDAYRQSGVTFLMPSEEIELTDQTIIDISHESLMRVWTRLRHWVEEEAQAAGIYRRLSESAALHAEGKAGLFRDPELGIALAWREAQHPNQVWGERYHPDFESAMRFLEESQRASVAEEEALEVARQHELEQAQQLADIQRERLEQQKRTASKLRKLMGGVAGIAVIAAIACVFALIARSRANHLAGVAEQKTEIAEKSQQDAEDAQRDTKSALDQVNIEKTNAEQSLILAQQAEERSRNFRYATDMQLAGRLIDDENSNARQILDYMSEHDPAQSEELAGKADPRGFEWHYLRRMIDSRATVFRGFDKLVVDSVLTPEGELITLDEGSQLERQDAETRLETHAPLDLKQGRKIASQALSPDGRLVALSIGNQVQLIDTLTGEETARPIPMAAKFGLIFSPDGKMLVTIDQKIGWWEAATGRLIALEDSHLTSGGPVSVSADGLTLAMGGQSGRFSSSDFSVFRANPDAREITLLLDKKYANIGSIRTLALSPDGKVLIVTQLFSGNLVLFDSETGAVKSGNSSEHAASISAIGFNPAGTEMVTASLDGTVKVWEDFQDLTSPKTTGLMGHADKVHRILFAPDGKKLVSSSHDMTTRLWDLEQKSSTPQVAVEGAVGLRARFSPDGMLIAASASGTRRVSLWDATTGKVVGALARPDNNMRPDCIAFSPNNRLLAMGFGGTNNVSFIELWDIDRNELLATLPGTTGIPNFTTTAKNGLISALAFSPDGKHLVAGYGSLSSFTSGDGGSHPLLVYDVATRRLIRRLEGHRNYCISVIFSQNGSLMASASYDGTARIWDTATWKTTQILNNPDPSSDQGSRRVLDVAFSPDTELLAMASHEGNVHVWNVDTGELVQTLRGHTNGVWSVAFSPDGKTLASGSQDQTIRLWNRATWRELLQLENKTSSGARSLAFSPAGDRLLSAGSGTYLWSTRADDAGQTAQLVQQLRKLLDSEADFQHRIRMFSENLQLHFALDVLLREKPDDIKLQAASAATRANWHASREEWTEAAQAFDQLKAVSPKSPAGWLKTPGLLRVAMALLQQKRPADAANLLAGGAKRRADDGLPLPSVNTVEDQTTIVDRASNRDLVALIETVKDALAESPRHAALLELRAELAGQWSGFEAQVADYTTAIEILSERPEAEAAADLARLYRHRGDAYVGLKKWQLAKQDYDRIDTDEIDDDELLANLTLAKAEVLLSDVWTVLKPVQLKSSGGATLAVQDDGSILASGTNPPEDVYTLIARPELNQIMGILLEAIPDPTLPFGGPGRSPNEGNFHLHEILVFSGNSPVALSDIDVTFDQSNAARVKLAIDGELDDQIGWSVYTKPGQPNSAVISLQLERAPDEELKIELHFPRAKHKQHNLGKFRLSVTDNPNYGPHASALVVAARSLRDPWQKLAAAYRINQDQPAIDELAWQRPEAAGVIGNLFIEGKEKDWQRAIEIYSHGITPETTDVELLSKRAHAFEELMNWDLAAADWFRAADGNQNGPELLTEFAKRLIAEQQSTLAQTQLERAQQLLEADLETAPHNFVVIEQLAQVLLDKIENEKYVAWSVLKPVETKTEAGTNFTLQEDGSILHEQTAGGTIQIQVPSRPLQVLRIETDSQSATSSNGAPIFSEYQIVAANLAASQTEKLRGRFVRIDLPGDNAQFPRKSSDGNSKSINLAELQVFRNDENVALGKFARQSSVNRQHEPGGGYKAGYAVDGITTATAVIDLQNNPFAETHYYDRAPWWEVDLGSEQSIDRMVVWNRTGGDTPNRMNHFRIRVLDQSRKVVFEQVIDKAPNPSREIVPPEIEVVQSTTDATLSLRLPPDAIQSRFRLSAADKLIDLSLTPVRQITEAPTRLAVAYALVENNAESVKWLDRALNDSETDKTRAAIIGHLQPYDEPLAALLKLHPDDLQLQLAHARNLVERGKSDLSENLSTEALVKLLQARTQFEALLTKYPEPDWTVLEPLEMSSEGGATLTLQEDNSILASGENPARDTYTVTANAGSQPLTAFRLEALPDPSLPENGPGRFDGNFHLNEFRVSSEGAKVPLTDIAVSFEEVDQMHHVIDGKVDGMKGWGTDTKAGQTSIAVMATDSKNGPFDRLKFELFFSRASAEHHNLGRFRLSVTGDGGAIEATQLHSDLTLVELANLDVALGKAYVQQKKMADAATAFSRALDRVKEDADRKLIVEQIKDELEVLTLLAERHPNDTQIQLALAKKHAQSGNQLLSQNRQTEALSELNKARAIFVRLLADSPEPEWTVLEPTELISEAGATLTLQDDDSVFVGGNLSVKDTITFETDGFPVDVSAIRLEAIQDERLPKGGPGTHSSGNFVLSEFKLLSGQSSEAELNETIPIRAAFATHEDRPVKDSLSVGESGWSIYGGTGNSQTAVFVLGETNASTDLNKIKIVMDYYHDPYDNVPALIGQFRLAVTNDPQVIQSTELHQEIQASGLPNLNLALGKAYGRQGQIEESATAFGRVFDLTPHRAARAKILDDLSAYEGVLDQLAQQKSAHTAFQDALARHYRAKGDVPNALSALSQSRALYEQQLQAEPTNSKHAQDLADLLVDVDSINRAADSERQVIVIESNGTLGRFRLSVRRHPQVINLLPATKSISPWSRLGAAYVSRGESDKALEMFARSIELAGSEQAKAAIAQEAAAFEEIFTQLLERFPNDNSLPLGQARYQAPKDITEKKFQEVVDQTTGLLKFYPQDIELLKLRAEALRKLKQWQAAIEDQSRIAELETDQGKQRDARRLVAEAQIRLGQIEEPVETYTRQMLLYPGWTFMRDACAAQLLARNPATAKVAAAQLYESFANRDADAGWSNWLVRVHTAVPGLVTNDNQARLLKAAQKAGGDFTEPMTAAIYYRLGDLERAQPLVTTSRGKPLFEGLATMLLYDRGESSQAREFLARTEGWFQQQRERDPESAIPAQESWQHWSMRSAVLREAKRKLAGPRLEELDAQLTKAPDNADAILERAGLLMEAGLNDEALENLNFALKLKTDPNEAVGLRGRILAGMNKSDEALIDLSQAIDQGSTDAFVYASRGHILVDQGSPQQALTDFNRSLELQPTETAAQALADLLLSEAKNTIAWTLLKPTEMKSVGGATLALLEDGSILAGGENPSNDQYDLVIETDQKAVTAFRLEVLTDESLPNNGPGRGRTGTFATGWRFNYRHKSDTEADRSISIQEAVADFSYSKFPIKSNRWNIKGGVGSSHEAYLAPDAPLQSDSGFQFKFALLGTNRPPYEDQNVGRFRLSVSDDPQAFEYEKNRLAALKLTNTWARLFAVYRLAGNEATFAKLLEKRPELQLDMADYYVSVQDWESALALYNEFITDETKDPLLLAKRAEAYSGAGQWDLAEADWMRAFEQAPELSDTLFHRYRRAERWNEAAISGRHLLTQRPEDSLLWLKLTTVLVMGGDEAGYKELCLKMAKQFEQSTKPKDFERVCKASILLPGVIDLSQLPEKSFTDALDAGTVQDWFPQWAWQTRAALAYRRENTEEALKYVTKSEELEPEEKAHANNLPLLVMILHKLERQDESRKTFDEATKFIKGLQNNPELRGDHDLLFALILLREAEKLITVE